MSDRDTMRGADTADVRRLLTAGRAERPLEGARARALDATLRAVAHAPVAAYEKRTTRARRFMASLVWAAPVVAAGITVIAISGKPRVSPAIPAVPVVAQPLLPRVEAADSVEERAALERQLNEAKAQSEKARMQLGATPASAKPNGPPKTNRVDAGVATGTAAAARKNAAAAARPSAAACACQSNDPLCSCL